MIALRFLTLTLPATVLAQILVFVSSASACQDGVDCLCDRLPADRNDVVFCEDFENPRLQEPCGWQGGGGCGSSPPYGGWEDQNYSGITGSCGGSSAKNNDITNVGKCIDITAVNDPSSTDLQSVPSSNLVFAEKHSMAQVNRPSPNGSKTGGIHGLARFSGNRHVSDWGMTMAIYYTENLEPQGSAWKGDQYTPARWGLGGSTTAVCGGGMSKNAMPYAGKLWWSASDTTPFTNHVGRSCRGNDGKIHVMPNLGTGANQYTFKRGVWRCHQMHYKGWGTPNGRIRHWWDGELVVDVSIDLSQPRGGAAQPSTKGLRQFEWNNYWNGSGSPQGYKGNNISGRIKDNIVFVEGPEPVTCADIGFGNVASPAPPPISQDPPQPPVLLDVR